MDNEYVRCGDDAPCTVASDLHARVRELEERLRRLYGAFMAFAHAAVERHHEPFIPRDLAGLYEATVRAAQSADHALLTTSTKEVMPHYPDGPPGPHSTPAPVVMSAAGADFMLPAPMPATPIPPDPRDAVVEAAKELFAFDQIESDSWSRDLDKLRAAVHALHAAEGRG